MGTGEHTHQPQVAFQNGPHFLEPHLSLYVSQSLRLHMLLMSKVVLRRYLLLSCHIRPTSAPSSYVRSVYQVGAQTTKELAAVLFFRWHAWGHIVGTVFIGKCSLFASSCYGIYELYFISLSLCFLQTAIMVDSIFSCQTTRWQNRICQCTLIKLNGLVTKLMVWWNRPLLLLRQVSLCPWKKLFSNTQTLRSYIPAVCLFQLQAYLRSSEIADQSYVASDREALAGYYDLSKLSLGEQVVAHWQQILYSTFDFTFNDELTRELLKVTTDDIVQVLHQYFLPSSLARRKISFRYTPRKDAPQLKLSTLCVPEQALWFSCCCVASVITTKG